MKMKFNFKSVLTKLIFIVVGIYLVVTFVKQQERINSYNSNIDYLTSQIDEKEEYKAELTAIKENINSPEYIEEMAREKLNMYKPNEKVYIDIRN